MTEITAAQPEIAPAPISFDAFVEKEGHDPETSPPDALAVLRGRYDAGVISAFEAHDLLDREVYMAADLRAYEHPASLICFSNTAFVLSPEEQIPETYYGFVQRGSVELITRSGSFRIHEGMYFCAPDAIEVKPGMDGGSGIIVTRHAYKGMFSLGGPIEPTGRLRYIDGCTDSLLIPPTVHGDACLNHLHFPAGIDQTAHTHPTARIGIVVRGQGECETNGGEILPLKPGRAFVLHPEGLHKFRTGNTTMDVIAFHPDSDTGPQHDDHPMVNRTIVQGVSAKDIKEIRTQ